MAVEARGFAKPTKREDLSTGDIFYQFSGSQNWLLMQARDAKRDDDYLVVLDGPQGDRPWPGIIDTNAVGSGPLACLPPFEVRAEPSEPGELPTGNENAGNGCLIIDANGEAWIHIAEHQYRLYCSLRSGEQGQPSRPWLSYAKWALCLRDEKDPRIVLARFGD